MGRVSTCENYCWAVQWCFLPTNYIAVLRLVRNVIHSNLMKVRVPGRVFSGAGFHGCLSEVWF